MNPVNRMGRRMLEVYRETDPPMQAQAAKLGATCREGCAHCCRLLTITSLPEAVAVVEYVLAKPLGADLLQTYIRRANEMILAWHRLGEIEPGSHLAARLRCMFLDGNDRCSVYPARPGTCRNHFVTNAPEVCGGPIDTITSKVDARPIEDAITGEALRASQRAGIGFVYAPLAVMLVYASILVVQGRDAFDRAVDNPPSEPFDLGRWQNLTFEGLERRGFAPKAMRP